jgi:hypothetical protein
MRSLKKCWWFLVCLILVGSVGFTIWHNNGKATIQINTIPKEYVGEFLLERPGGGGESVIASLILKHRDSEVILFRQQVGYSYDTMSDALGELSGWTLEFESSSGKIVLINGSSRVELQYTTRKNSDLR